MEKILNRLFRPIYRLFCEHEYDLKKRVTQPWSDSSQDSIIETYYCKKCGKIHTICTNFKFLLGEEIKRQEFLVRNEINKQKNTKI